MMLTANFLKQKAKIAMGNVDGASDGWGLVAVQGIEPLNLDLAVAACRWRAEELHHQR